MNPFDDVEIDKTSFAYRDLKKLDRWVAFTPTFTSLTVVGATNYTGRVRVVGKQAFLQAQISAATSIASTAGTTYMTLPITAKGLSGAGTMQNLTTNVSVGNCVIDATNSRLYIPTQTASGNTFSLTAWWEV